MLNFFNLGKFGILVHYDHQKKKKKNGCITNFGQVIAIFITLFNMNGGFVWTHTICLVFGFWTLSYVKGANIPHCLVWIWAWFNLSNVKWKWKENNSLWLISVMLGIIISVLNGHKHVVEQVLTLIYLMCLKISKLGNLEFKYVMINVKRNYCATSTRCCHIHNIIQ
jgi:hypothetical protein